MLGIEIQIVHTHINTNPSYYIMYHTVSWPREINTLTLLKLLTTVFTLCLTVSYSLRFTLRIIRKVPPKAKFYIFDSRFGVETQTTNVNTTHRLIYFKTQSLLPYTTPADLWSTHSTEIQIFVFIRSK